MTERLKFAAVLLAAVCAGMRANTISATGAGNARITFWGVNDAESWLNNFPTGGRTNYPLLFDRQGKPKPAFDAILEVGKTTGGIR